MSFNIEAYFQLSPTAEAKLSQIVQKAQADLRSTVMTRRRRKQKKQVIARIRDREAFQSNATDEHLAASRAEAASIFAKYGMTPPSELAGIASSQAQSNDSILALQGFSQKEALVTPPLFSQYVQTQGFEPANAENINLQNLTCNFRHSQQLTRVTYADAQTSPLSKIPMKLVENAKVDASTVMTPQVSKQRPVTYDAQTSGRAPSEVPEAYLEASAVSDTQKFEDALSQPPEQAEVQSITEQPNPPMFSFRAPEVLVDARELRQEDRISATLEQDGRQEAPSTKKKSKKRKVHEFLAQVAAVNSQQQEGKINEQACLDSKLKFLAGDGDKTPEEAPQHQAKKLKYSEKVHSILDSIHQPDKINEIREQMQMVKNLLPNSISLPAIQPRPDQEPAANEITFGEQGSKRASNMTEQGSSPSQKNFESRQFSHLEMEKSELSSLGLANSPIDQSQFHTPQQSMVQALKAFDKDAEISVTRGQHQNPSDPELLENAEDEQLSIHQISAVAEVDDGSNRGSQPLKLQPQQVRETFGPSPTPRSKPGSKLKQPMKVHQLSGTSAYSHTERKDQKQDRTLFEDVSKDLKLNFEQLEIEPGSSKKKAPSVMRPEDQQALENPSILDASYQRQPSRGRSSKNSIFSKERPQQTQEDQLPAAPIDTRQSLTSQPLQTLKQENSQSSGSQHQSQSQSLAKKSVAPPMVSDELSPNMYEEFYNCESHLYEVPEKDTYDSISSDGEFQDIKEAELKPENDTDFVEKEYFELEARAKDQGIEITTSLRDQFWNEALCKINNKARNRKYFKMNLVSKSHRVVPRWASDMPKVNSICLFQKAKINSDAIFGRIDPRNSDMVKLKEMFTVTLPSQARRLRQNRGSSARNWNDNSEFATPNILAKEEQENYLIDTQNVQEVSSFNPFVAQMQLSQQTTTHLKTQ